jgi:hypothetical protein
LQITKVGDLQGLAKRGQVAAPLERLAQLCVESGQFYELVHGRMRSSEMQIMMLNPWIFGIESVQRGWQEQFRLMRLFAGCVPDQTTSSPLIQDTLAVDIKAQEAVAPAAIADEQEVAAAIADRRRRKAPNVLRVSDKASRVNPGAYPKRAAASQNRALKTVRRSGRKPR